MANRSLDDFASEPEAASDRETSDSTPDEPRADGAADAPEPAEDADPAVATFAWAPGGAACESCDEVVERRWCDDDRLVCERCKPW